MLEAVRLVDIRRAPLSIDEAFGAVADSSTGGVCVFVGSVRDHDRGAAVAELSYTSHPTAVAELEKVARDVAEQHSDVVAVAAVHRVGDLKVGDIAVIVAVAAGHRPAAFEACRALIDQLKERVPLWKNQQYASGETAWL